MITREWTRLTLETGGMLTRAWGDSEGSLGRACIDSRAIAPGEIFVALKGEHTDGHRFARKALEKGAGALLLSEAPLAEELAAAFPDRLLLLVEDVLAALQHLASRWVAETGATVVGITGSNGKTGTKNFCAAALSVLGRTEASRGNLNNLIGLPLSTLGLAEDTRYLAAEMGCSSFGEIARLAELFRPRIGIVANVGDAHLEILGDRDGVARAKGELPAALPEDGLFLVNGDDAYASSLAGRSSAPTLRYGFGEGNDLVLEDLGPEGPGRRCRIEGRELRLASPMRHAILQAGAAWLLARELGADIEPLAKALEEARPEGNRSALYRLNGWILMDDSYNANPDSLRAALGWLKEFPAGGRRWAVLGDMLELGDQELKVHRGLGNEIAQMGGIGLRTYGPLAGEMSKAAGASQANFDDHGKLAADLLSRLAEGDVILVKGSRGMEMEKVIEALERATGLSREAMSIVL